MLRFQCSPLLPAPTSPQYARHPDSELNRPCLPAPELRCQPKQSFGPPKARQYLCFLRLIGFNTFWRPQVKIRIPSANRKGDHRRLLPAVLILSVGADCRVRVQSAGASGNAVQRDQQHPKNSSNLSKLLSILIEFQLSAGCAVQALLDRHSVCRKCAGPSSGYFLSLLPIRMLLGKSLVILFTLNPPAADTVSLIAGSLLPVELGPPDLSARLLTSLCPLVGPPFVYNAITGLTVYYTPDFEPRNKFLNTAS